MPSFNTFQHPCDSLNSRPCTAAAIVTQGPNGTSYCLINAAQAKANYPHLREVNGTSPLMSLRSQAVAVFHM